MKTVEEIRKENNYYDVMPFVNGVAIACNGVVWKHHVGLDGKRIDPCLIDYHTVENFSEGRAVVRKNSKSTYINLDGSFAFKKWFNEAYNFNNGIARVREGNDWYHINVNGEPLYPERYDLVEPFINGVAKVYKGKDYLYIDMKGDPVKVN